jgi:hypothetical protein
VVLSKDDPRLLECPDPVITPERPWFMRVWFEKIQALDNRPVKLPESKIIDETDVLWPSVEVERI